MGDTPEFDQRGYPFDRAVDAPGTPQTGAIIDIGAFEYGYTADADGFVDGSDFLAWQRGFGMTSGATREDGDFDGDGDVDSHDLDIWRAMFGSTPSPVDEEMALAFAATPSSQKALQPTIAPLDSTPSFVDAAEREPTTVVSAFEAALAGLTYPRIEQWPRTPHTRPARHPDDAVRTSTNVVEPTLPLRRWSAMAEVLLDDSAILHHDESPADWFDNAFELL